MVVKPRRRGQGSASDNEGHMTLHDVQINEARLAEFCRQRRIRELLIFGSLTRDDFGPDSDVDLAIEYAPDASVSLWDFAGDELDLTDMLGRPVHLTEKKTIPAKLVDLVLKGAVPAYAA